MDNCTFPVPTPCGNHSCHSNGTTYICRCRHGYVNVTPKQCVKDGTPVSNKVHFATGSRKSLSTPEKDNNTVVYAAAVFGVSAVCLGTLVVFLLIIKKTKKTPNRGTPNHDDSYEIHTPLDHGDAKRSDDSPSGKFNPRSRLMAIREIETTHSNDQSLTASFKSCDVFKDQTSSQASLSTGCCSEDFSLGSTSLADIPSQSFKSISMAGLENINTTGEGEGHHVRFQPYYRYKTFSASRDSISTGCCSINFVESPEIRSRNSPDVFVTPCSSL